MSDQFQIFSGARQGSILSPFLFNLAIDHAMETALDCETFGITLDDMLVTNSDYADDKCLSEDCPVKAQKMLDLVTTKGAGVGLSINVPKTKFCSHDRMIQLQCNAQPLEAVQEFTCVGSKIQLDDNITSEIKTRVAKAAGSFKMLSSLEPTVCTIALKNKSVHACVRSVLLYGCESWPIKQSDINMIVSFENRCIRKVIPQGHALSTNQIREAADLSKSVKSLIQKARLAGICAKAAPRRDSKCGTGIRERRELENSRGLAYLMEKDSTGWDKTFYQTP